MRGCGTFLCNNSRLSVFRYYVIRDEMLVYFVDSLIQELSNRPDPNQGWEVGLFYYA